MSKRKTDTLGDLAAGAAHGKRVVASVGQLDGPLLLALQRLNLSEISDTAEPVSTWADGVQKITQDDNGISKSISDMPERGVNDGA